MRCAAKQRWQPMYDYCGEMKQSNFPFLCFRFVRGILVELIVGSIIFQVGLWDFWRHSRKQRGFRGRSENVVFGVRCEYDFFDVWATMTTRSMLGWRGQSAGRAEVFWDTLNWQFCKCSRERISGCKQWRKPLKNLVEGLHWTAKIRILATVQAE